MEFRKISVKEGETVNVGALLGQYLKCSKNKIDKEEKLTPPKKKK